MKVAVLISLLGVGGTEVQTLALVRALEECGFAVSVICYGGGEPGVIGAFEAAGAEVVCLGEADAVHHPTLASLAALGWRIVREIRLRRPDVAHVQYMAPGLLGVLASRVAGVRIVFATVHQPGRCHSGRARRLLRTAARLCDAFTCVSQSVETSWFPGPACRWTEAAHKERRPRHFTLYNCVDVDAVQANAAEGRTPSYRRELGLGGGPVLGVTGRLRKEKGHAWLLDAVLEASSDFPALALLVVGDGPARGSLEARARDLGIQERVVFLGEVDPASAFRAYGAMDLLVVPSMFEGFGLSAAEGMAAGLPVIASDVDGLREVVADGLTGILVPVGDVRKLAAAIRRVLGDADLGISMGDAGAARIRENFSVASLRLGVRWLYGDALEVAGAAGTGDAPTPAP